MKLLGTPPVTADTNTIQNLFMQIVRDIKKDAESAAEEQTKATTEVLEYLRANLAKDGEAVGLSNMTAEDLTAAVMKTISEATFSRHNAKAAACASDEYFSIETYPLNFPFNVRG